MVTKRTALAAIVSLVLGGCTAMRDHPTLCKAITTASGAVVGGTLGGVLVGEFEGGTGGDSGEIAAGTGGGFVGGGLIGYLIGHYACPKEGAPPPPPPPPPAKGTKIADIPGPNFELNKSTLTPAGRAKVTEAAQILKSNPTIHVEVGGYTDSIGSDKYNLGLSERRARTVADALVNDGISPSRLTVRGYGKTHPIADNGTEAGRARNRRVELVVD
ncbi:MAG TPA: OmpA family protein [Candidatus Eisenbacteria bacterium]|nr:OmpA family protein [Candidatus Eisenbacteria bacterium]